MTGCSGWTGKQTGISCCRSLRISRLIENACLYWKLKCGYWVCYLYNYSTQISMNCYHIYNVAYDINSSGQRVNLDAWNQYYQVILWKTALLSVIWQTKIVLYTFLNLKPWSAEHKRKTLKLGVSAGIRKAAEWGSFCFEQMMYSSWHIPLGGIYS